MNKLSQASQDYLKTIYRITKNGGRATTNQLAQELAVQPASVTSMVQKMAKNEPPLISYEKHQGVVLTAVGEDTTLKIIRRHQIIESYLHTKLGYDWDEAHEEASRLEHAICDTLSARMAAALGYPEPLKLKIENSTNI